MYDSCKEDLLYALEKGIIDVSYVQAKVDMLKKEELLKKHPYEIWLGNDGFWRTYIPSETKGRVLKKRKNKADIEKAIVEYWKEATENPTVKEVYVEWMNDKLSRNDISYATKNRYDRQFAQCFGVFGERKIKTIDAFEVEEFMLNAIYEHELTRKGYGNLRTLVYGIFKRAKKKKYINYSITEVVSDMEISKKAFRKNYKSDHELVFTIDEEKQIIDYITSKEPTIIDLGILLCFKTGLRPGELAGLEKEDVIGNVINVSRTEITYTMDTGETINEVRNSPKTEAGVRTVILPDHYMWILKQIRILNPFGKYLFEKNGERIKTYQFTQRLKTICKYVGIKPKSVNKIRKSYISTLIDAKVNESIIISQVGHTDIKTSKEYYYKDRRTTEQKITILNNVVGL